MCTVLIADDDATIRTSLTYFLTSEGYSVFTAINAFEAYNTALELMPDIIISDIHMPELDGFELRNKLKENPKSTAIPLIFITADVTALANDRAVTGSSNIFITKPFMFEDILKAINDSLIGHS